MDFNMWRNEPSTSSGMRHSYFNGRSNDWRNSSKSVNIEVPSINIGRIIGKGGNKIKELQIESGANIQVTHETIGENTIVRIDGSSAAIRKAKELIEGLTMTIPTCTKSGNGTEVLLIIDHFNMDWNIRAQEYAWSLLPPVNKKFYEEDSAVAAMAENEVAVLRKFNNNIMVTQVLTVGYEYKHIPNPVQRFEQAFRNYPLILNEIQKAGFQIPTPIQTQAWPILLSGEDLIGIAQTGTGKTLAFLLPAFIHIDGQSVPGQKRLGPSVLVIAPTRELALQIYREVKKYSYKDITAICIYGGGSRKEQIKGLKKGVDIIIATPGRFNDFVQAGYISKKSISFVVFDEADRMLDMAFNTQISKVLYDIRPDRQTVAMCATWPMWLGRLADLYMINPLQVHVLSLDLAAVRSVIQVVKVMSDKKNEKWNTLVEFLRNMPRNEKVMIFCGKNACVENLYGKIMMACIDCQSFHGDREQIDREEALAEFSDGTVQILVTTSLASRGLDIDDITYVINYDFPENIEEYVHRAGRIGRTGRRGQAITYFTRADCASAKALIAVLKSSYQHVPEALYQMRSRYESEKGRHSQFSHGGSKFEYYAGGRYPSYA